MSHNLEYLLTRPGGLKITTLILGLVAAILNAHSYGDSPYTDYYEDKIKPTNNTFNYPGTELELSNMTSTFIFLGLSIIYLTAHSLFYVICESRLNKFLDVTFHLSGALFLFAGGIALVYSGIHIEKKGCPEFHKVQAGPIPKHHRQHLVPLSSIVATSVAKMFTSNSRLAADGSEDPNKMCHYFGEKIVGGSLNIVNGVVYGFLAVVIYNTELEEL